MKLPALLKLAGLLHLGLIAAGLCMPRAVGLRQHLAILPPFIRRLFWTYYCFIGLSLVSFGLISVVFADALASGTPLARAFCTFLTAFWLVRLGAAMFVFDVRPYLVNGFYRFGYQATNIVFAALPFIYAWAALKGATP